MKWFEFNNPAYQIKILDYTYTSQPSINTALPLHHSKLKIVLYYIGIILTFGFLWLLSKWSSKKKAIFTANICSIQIATHFLIHDEDSQGNQTLVERIDKYEIKMKRQCISFVYHDRNYVYIEEKEVFVPIRYQELGLHLDKLKKDKFQPYTAAKRKKYLNYYGENVMKLQIQSRLQIFIQSMLSPYEVFQTYGIILWITQQYYIFSFALFSYSLYTYWSNSSEIQSNQIKLAAQSYHDIPTKILINEGQQSQQVDSQKQQVQLRKNTLKLDEHKSQIMKDNFNEIQQQVQLTVRKSIKSQKQVRNEQNNLINNKNIKFQNISSHKLVPGDVIILNQKDFVPCDCILLRGQVLVNQQYTTGQNYLVRKSQIQNFIYTKQNQKSFILYLGTQIIKIKNQISKIRKRIDNQMQSIQLSLNQNQKIDYNREIVCLVIHTNFNTLKGKYLRAIRYQKKDQEQFFKETIYFIYILMLFCCIVYFVYLGLLGPYTDELKMFQIYMDLLTTAIPPTLPTILTLGMQFVMRRLKSHNIHIVMPKSAVTGGKIDTIILKGNEVFGSEFDIHSAQIGTKGQRGFGLTFSKIQQYVEYNQNHEFSYHSVEQYNLKRLRKTQFHIYGDYFINALSCCHTLQFHDNEIHGSTFQKKIFQFSSAKNISQDIFEVLNYTINLNKVIRFDNQKGNNKLGVLATIIQHKGPSQSYLLRQKFKRSTKHFIDQNDITKKISTKMNQIQQFDDDYKQQRNDQKVKDSQKKIIFIKGAADKILKSCNKKTYPQNTFEYIVDMAQKGFILFCYAMIEFNHEILPNFDYQDYINKQEFIFLGFIIIEQVKIQENIESISQLKRVDVNLIFVSEDRQLQATSKAITNGICTKNELILCDISKNKQKIYCKGHIQWESSTNSQSNVSEFLSDFQQFSRNSKVCLSADIYEEIFMKRQIQASQNLFSKAIIYNKMKLKHQKNLYNQLAKQNKMCMAVGKSLALKESCNLSLQLQRGQSAMLSSFYTTSTSLHSIINLLIICRAGMSTIFHGFSMIILFSLTQFTTFAILNMNFESLSNDQSLYEDLFITFPIFITINLTQPAQKLSKQLPISSFFSLRNTVSMLGQLLIQFLAQLSFFLYITSLDYFHKRQALSEQYYKKQGEFYIGSEISLAMFILSNNLYLGIVLSTSVSKPFRKPFYTNPFYTLNIIVIWLYNILIVTSPNLATAQMRPKNLNEQSQFVLVLALIVGNLMMVIMYLYQNLLVFLWGKENPCFKSNKQFIQMSEANK